MTDKTKIFYFKTITPVIFIFLLCSCSGSDRTNYDYQLAWSSFKIVNINVREDYKVQNILLELGISPMPEYIDIEVRAGFENENQIRLDNTAKLYSWSQISSASQNYLRGYQGSNKIKTY